MVLETGFNTSLSNTSLRTSSTQLSTILVISDAYRPKLNVDEDLFLRIHKTKDERFEFRQLDINPTTKVQLERQVDK